MRLTQVDVCSTLVAVCRPLVERCGYVTTCDFSFRSFFSPWQRQPMQTCEHLKGNWIPWDTIQVRQMASGAGEPNLPLRGSCWTKEGSSTENSMTKGT